MKYLGNGQYEIQSKTTGEKKIVQENELSSYGLSPNRGGQPITKLSGEGILSFFGLEQPAELIKAGLNTAGQVKDIAVGQFGTPEQKKAAGQSFKARQQAIEQSFKKGGLKIDKTPTQEQTPLTPILSAMEAPLNPEFARKALRTSSAFIPLSKGNILQKAATSGVVGTMRQAGEGEQFDTGKTVIAGLTSAALSPIFDIGATDLKGAGKFLTKRIPEDIYEKIITKPQEYLSKVKTQINQYLVGHQNVDYAFKKGIITGTEDIDDTIIKQSLEKTKDLAQKIEDQLQTKVKGVNVNLKEVYNGLMNIYNQIAPYEGKPNMTAIKTYLKKQGIKNTGQIDLSKIVALKRGLGNAYDKDNTFKTMYSYVKNYIENKSGLPVDVKNLNREAQTLVFIKSNLNQALNKKEIPNRLLGETIDQTIEKASQGDVPSLNAFIDVLSVAIGVGAGQSFGPVGVGIGGIGGAYVVSRALKSLVNRPETKKRIADKLMRLGIISKIGEKVPIEEMLKRLSTYVGQEVGGNF